MTKLGTFFEKKAGKSKRQETVERQYVENGIDLEPVFKEALSIVLKNDTPHKFRGRAFMANTMNWTLVGLLWDKYPDRMRNDVHGRDYFALDKGTRVYFKKLDKNYCPNNIPTNHVKDLNCMRLLFNHNPTTILYAGFRLREDEHWDDISCFLVEMRNVKKANWASNLSDLAIMISDAEAPVSPITKADIPKELVVTAKVNKEKYGDSSNK